MDVSPSVETLLGWLVGFVIRIYTGLDDPKFLVLSLVHYLVALLDFMILEWKFFVPVIVLVKIYYVLKHIASDLKIFTSAYIALNRQNETTLVELARDVRDMKEKFIEKRKAEIILP